MRLGLSKEEFFAMTPAMFADMRRAWLDERREMQTAIAMLRVDLINFSMRGPKEPVKLEDLLPGVKSIGGAMPRRGGVKLNKRMRTEIADSFRRMFGSMADKG